MTDGIWPVTVPKWGIEMQEGTVVGWHKAEGDEVNKGDELIDIETDKIVNTMEASASGVLRRQIAAKDTKLSVGGLLGVIATADTGDAVIDEFIAAFRPADASVIPDEPAAPATNEATKATAPVPVEPPPPASRKRVRVSPAAAQRARELGVDINKVQASGRRISPQDVERHAQQAGEAGAGSEEPAEFEATPLSATRQSIASKLVEAKQQIPHFYLSIDIGMDTALARREEINSGGGQKISVNDLVLRATVLALQSVPDVNVHLVQDEIRRFGHVNLAIAVSTEKGLITPVVQKAETLGMAELAQAANELGERARSATLARADVENGTFTVSNLGMHGIHGFQAIINPPQGAILAVGACETRVIPDGDGFRNAPVMRATLSCDHRAIDGALGAQFLAELKARLENPGDL